jgi:DNA-binding beta-propeller fold protein YncE
MRILAFRHLAAMPLLLILCLVSERSLAGQGGVPLDPAPTFVAFTPASVAADPRDQTLWVADRYLPRIAHLARDGSLLAVFPASAYGGMRPSGMTFEGGAAGDYLYVSDPDIGRLVRVDRLGHPLGAIPTGPLGILSPAGLAWDPSDDTLYVADPPARLVLKLRPRDLDLDGLPDAAEVVDSFNTAALGSDNPTGVALDPATRRLFISDPALDRVFEIAPDGSLFSSFNSGPYGGTSVTGIDWVASSGQLLLADMGRKILTVTRAGVLVNNLGTAPFGSLSPQGLAWDVSSRSFLAVTGERKLLQFQPADPSAAGSVEGTVQASQEWTSTFGCIAPSGIALDPTTGDRFVADSYQQRVFRINRLGGLVSTFDTSSFGSLSPTGIALGPAGGSLFLSDNQAKKIFEVTPSGVLLSSLTTTRFKRKSPRAEASNDPRGVAYDPLLDHLLIVDYQAARVFEITRNGSFVNAFPTAPGAPFPTDLALKGEENRIVVADSTGSFAEFSRAGILQERFPGVPVQVRISGAEGVSVDPDTLHRLVTDPGQDAVFLVSRQGTALSQISLEPYGVVSPSGAVWDAAGPFLYVVDRSMARVTRISPGPDGVFGPGDDSVLTASTSVAGSSMPVGLTVDRGLGRLGWADEQTDRIHWTTQSFSYVGSMDLSPAGVTAPRGVDRDPASNVLFVGDGTAGILVIGSSGQLLGSRSAFSLGIGDVGGVGLSPGEGTLMVVDRADRTLMSVATGSLLPP